MKISDDQKNNIAKLAKKYDLKLIILFGSSVDGKKHKNSDIDLGILSEKRNLSDSLLNVIADLISVFGNQVDVANLDYANPLLLHQVSKNSELIFGKEVDFQKFKLYAFHRYNDYQPYFKLEQQTNQKVIKKLCQLIEN